MWTFMSASALLTKSRQVLSEKIVHPRKKYKWRIEAKFFADDSLFPKQTPEIRDRCRPVIRSLSSFNHDFRKVPAVGRAYLCCRSPSSSFEGDRECLPRSLCSLPRTAPEPGTLGA